MEAELEALYASSIIHVSHGVGGIIDFSQVLTYDYEDLSPNHTYYDRVKTNLSFLEKELRTLVTNLQRFLDAETNIINDERVYPEVYNVQVEFKTSPRFPFYTWMVRWSGHETGTARNVYEARIEPDFLDYDIKSIYIFPRDAEILKIKSSLEYEIDENIVVFQGKKGQKVKELELISWKYQSKIS